MNTTDPIADLLTRIRNACKAHQSKVEMPSSRMKAEIAKILKEEGYISSYKVSEEDRKKTLRITLKYGADGKPAVAKLERVSRPGRLAREDSKGARRPRQCHPHHAPGIDDGQKGAQDRRGRGNPGGDLVAQEELQCHGLEESR
jgi:small subunit ribosomal protein S8